jgi:hypothetical protein
LQYPINEILKNHNSDEGLIVLLEKKVLITEKEKSTKVPHKKSRLK